MKYFYHKNSYVVNKLFLFWLFNFLDKHIYILCTYVVKEGQWSKNIERCKGLQISKSQQTESSLKYLPFLIVFFLFK